MKYIFVCAYGSFDKYMYRDLFVTNRAKAFFVNRPYKSHFITFIRRVHRSRKVNKIMHLPFQDVWYRPLLKMIEDDTCLVFTTLALGVLKNTDFLYELKSAKKNVKMALFIVDSFHGTSKPLKDEMTQYNIFNFPWDAILSYDKYDCKEFGFDYLGPHIYSTQEHVRPSKEKSDLYFVGRDKGRSSDIVDIYKKCISKGGTTNFALIDFPQEICQKYLKSNGVHFSKEEVHYEDVISNLLSSKCILEIVSGNQKAQTARYYEAVCYNKKLLTNNPSVKDLQFYDPRYMQYFETIDDIDFDWIKKEEKIDYHYNGEFSPLHALEKLEKILAR